MASGSLFFIAQPQDLPVAVQKLFGRHMPLLGSGTMSVSWLKLVVTCRIPQLLLLKPAQAIESL